jgi:hypothetical protein
MLDALTDLRESGQIPCDAIVDETRSLDDFTGYRSIAEGVDAYISVFSVSAICGLLSRITANNFAGPVQLPTLGKT